MECLICYEFVDLDLSNDDLSTTTEKEINDLFYSPTISRLFDLSSSTLNFEKNDNSSRITICPMCHKKIDQVGHLFDQLDEIQMKLSEMRKDILYDLIKSQKLSEDNDKQLGQRIRIIQEACTILNEKYDQEGQGQEDDNDDEDNSPLYPTVQLKVDDQIQSPSQLQSTTNTNGDNANYVNGTQDQEPDSSAPDPLGQPIDDNDTTQAKKLKLTSNKSISKTKNIKKVAIVNQKKLRDKRNLKGKISPVSTKSRILRKRKTSQDTDDHHKSLFTCKHCTMTFKSEYLVKKHKLKDHTIEVKKRSEVWHQREKFCKLCNKEFARPGALDNHIKVHHTEEKSEVCYVCGRAYPTTRSLKAHLVVHGIGTVVYKCDICGKFNGNNNLLQRHLARVHGFLVPETKSFLCEVCSKSFVSENTLKEHQQSIHMGEKFSCDKCVKSFTTSGGLNAHVKSIHEKAFKSFCPTCNKGFLSNSEMNRHHSSTHEGIKKFSCGELDCNARFFTLSRLKYHFKSAHTLERDFFCSVCSKGFVTKTKMKNHEILHTGFRPHLCTICGESYTIKSSLAQHIREVHEGRKVLIADITKRRKFKRRNRVEIVGNLAEIDTSMQM